jgi:O-antigen ligase
MTPFGDKLIHSLPIFGSTAANLDTLLYRERLAERSWELIQQHPLLGDQLAFTKMEDLRQGQGIIDFVNTYAEVALSYGIIGLSLLIGFILVALIKSQLQAKRAAQSDSDFALLGVSLTACIVGVLLMITDNSFWSGVQRMFFVLAGLAAAYARIGRIPEIPERHPLVSAARGGSSNSRLRR